jgi:hypothetical protein
MVPIQNRMTGIKKRLIQVATKQDPARGFGEE